MILDDAMNNLPVYFFIVVNGDITKTHGLLEMVCQLGIQQAGLSQQIEGLTHGVRWLNANACNQVCADIDCQLHSTTKIE